jgi:hypothetical protein
MEKVPGRLSENTVYTFSSHPREGGDPGIFKDFWIPAFAGMTS